MTASIAVVIPTRNRAPLARNAVRSLLDQDCPLDIFVSDNSPSPGELADLGAPDLRVHVLSPPSELTVADHWDWALRQAMERSSATHFFVHSDRRWATPQSWGAIEAIAGRWPARLITVGCDSITAVPPPLRLWQAPWTGRTFAVRSATAAGLVAEARIAATAHALPLLHTSVVPRTILHTVVERFGDICQSTGPDAAFMARFLALHDAYLVADRVTGIMYAAHRSSNLGYLGSAGGDFADHVHLHGDRPWLDAAPVPGISLGSNMLFHEYELVRCQTGDRLPALDRAAYLDELGSNLRWIDDDRRRQELRSTLVGAGWQPVADPPTPQHTWRARWAQARTTLLARLGTPPATISGFAFRDDDAALRYAMRYPRRPQESAEHLAGLGAERLDP